MFPDSTIEQIRELLKDGLSQRGVARKLSVSRSVVSRVARGERMETNSKGDNTRNGFQIVPPTRCGGCGALIVEVPCRACYLRSVTNQAAPGRALELDA